MQRNFSISFGRAIAFFSEIGCSIVGAHVNTWSKPPVSCSPEPPDAGVAVDVNGPRGFKKSFIPEIECVISRCISKF
jgi:hypothetical protein